MSSQSQPSCLSATKLTTISWSNLARLKGVGKLEQPPAVDNRAGEGLQPAEAVARREISKINFEAPDYLATALKIHAAQERTSVRHVILKALRDGGFAIDDADMIEDGRRLRGSNRLPLGQHETAHG